MHLVKNFSSEWVAMLGIEVSSYYIVGEKRREEAVFGHQLQLAGDVSHKGGESHGVQPVVGHLQQDFL